MTDRVPENSPCRSTNIEVREKQTCVQREQPLKVQADLTSSPSDAIPPTDQANQSTVPQPKPLVDTSPKEVIAVFTPLEEIPYEPEPWQAVGLLKKTGVTVLVAPSGSCSFALSAYFAAHLSGRGFVPFGRARYAGDVLFSTSTPGLARSLRAAASTSFMESKQILVQETPLRFDWRLPTATIEGALESRTPGSIAAVIIDAGPPPHRLDESKIDAAHAALRRLARQHDCMILLVVEHTSKDSDPFERVPRSMRALRGTLLAAPLRSKALAPQPDAPAEFLLMRLADATPSALTVPFTLWPVADPVETTSIRWGEIKYENPREAFRRAETIDLSTAERVAVQLAVDVIQQRGPTSAVDLQAAGRLMRGIAPTTMRDALSVAKLLGYLDTARSLEGKSFWIIPGVTPIPNWMYMAHALTDRQIPF